MSPKTRPVSSQMPATSPIAPFGFAGYGTDTAAPLGEVEFGVALYLITNLPPEFIALNTVSSRTTSLPSPCATGKFHFANSLQKHAIARLNRQVDPARLELT